MSVRLAFRSLRAAPAFTAAAVVTLALGIGANTTIFSAVNATILRPPNARDAGGIVRVYRNDHSPLSWQELSYVREHARSFSSVFGERWATVGLTGAGANSRVAADVVSGSFFSTLGTRPALGRLFTAADDAAPGAHPVVVLSHRYWTRHLNADPAVIGSTLTLNRHPYTVVGVAEEGFAGPFPGFSADLWAPLAEAQPLLGTDLSKVGGSLYTAARLRPGATRRSAEVELATLAAQLTAADPERAGKPELVIHFTTDDARGLTAELRRPAGLVAGGLLAVVVIVLLIAGTNVANMTLARATARRREFAVRQALGAGRWPIVRQLLAETVMLALAGGALAVVASLWTGDLLTRFIPPDLPVAIDVSPDRRVFAFALVVSVVAGLLFGLAPALRASRPDLVAALRDELSGYRRSRLRSAFVLSWDPLESTCRHASLSIL